MLALLAEADKGKSSFYAPYIATLPTAVDNPLAYSKEQRAELDGTLAAPLLKTMRSSSNRPPPPPSRRARTARRGLLVAIARASTARRA